MREGISNDALFVLAYFGLGVRDFSKLERIVDFEAMANSIRKSTKIAVCNILDGKGDVVVNNGKPVRVHIEVAVKDALKELAKKSLRWIKWF